MASGDLDRGSEERSGDGEELAGETEPTELSFQGVTTSQLQEWDPTGPRPATYDPDRGAERVPSFDLLVPKRMPDLDQKPWPDSDGGSVTAYPALLANGRQVYNFGSMVPVEDPPVTGEPYVRNEPDPLTEIARDLRRKAAQRNREQPLWHLHLLAYAKLRETLTRLSNKLDQHVDTATYAAMIDNALDEASMISDPHMWVACDAKIVSEPPCLRQHRVGADGVRRHNLLVASS